MRTERRDRRAEGEVLQLPSSEVIRRRVVCAFAPESLKDLLEVKGLVEASALNAFDWHLLRGDLGYAGVCFGDYAFAKAFNPSIEMVRDKTLMQGHDCCNHRYLWKG